MDEVGRGQSPTAHDGLTNLLVRPASLRHLGGPLSGRVIAAEFPVGVVRTRDGHTTSPSKSRDGRRPLPSPALPIVASAMAPGQPSLPAPRPRNRANHEGARDAPAPPPGRRAEEDAGSASSLPRLGECDLRLMSQEWPGLRRQSRFGQGSDRQSPPVFHRFHPRRHDSKPAKPPHQRDRPQPADAQSPPEPVAPTGLGLPSSADRKHPPRHGDPTTPGRHGDLGRGGDLEPCQGRIGPEVQQDDQADDRTGLGEGLSGRRPWPPDFTADGFGST